MRDWAAIAPDSATFKNAYKIRALKDGETETRPVPHTFIFAKRGSFLPSEKELVSQLVTLQTKMNCLWLLFGGLLCA